MAIDSYLYGNTANDEMIMSAVSSIVPNEDLFSTLSGNEPFSSQYKLYVPISVTVSGRTIFATEEFA